MSLTRTDRNQTFDGDGNLVHEETVIVDVTEAAVTYDLHVKARAALTSNQTFLAISSPTNAQLAAQVKALTRQINAVIRLLVGSDLLVESGDV